MHLRIPAFFFMLASMSALMPIVHGHIQLMSPPPRGSQYNPRWTGPIDYDIMAPLGPGKPFPCQGKPAGLPVTTLVPGSVQMQFGVGANHDGGHCQFAVSYDSGVTWVVLHTIVRSCFRNSESSYVVPIPANLPSCDRCILSWNWINAIGNREYYTNCVDVSIRASSSRTFSGPKLLVVNIPGYPIIPEFPGNSPDHASLLSSRPIITVTAGASGGTTSPPLSTTTGSVSSTTITSSTTPSTITTSSTTITSTWTGPPPTKTWPTSITTTSSTSMSTTTTSRSTTSSTTSTTTRSTTSTTTSTTSRSTTSSTTRSTTSTTSRSTTSSTFTTTTRSTTSSTPTTTSSSTQTTTVGTCQTGSMRCASTSIQQCVNGAWTTVKTCPSGYRCLSGNSGIMCVQ